MPVRGDREGFQAERLLPALLYVFLLSVFKTEKKSTVTCLIVCSWPQAHGGVDVWGLTAPESADRWPPSAWEVGAGDLLRVGVSDTTCLFAISLGYSFSQTYLGGEFGWWFFFPASKSSRLVDQEKCLPSASSSGVFTVVGDAESDVEPGVSVKKAASVMTRVLVSGRVCARWALDELDQTWAKRSSARWWGVQSVSCWCLPVVSSP